MRNSGRGGTVGCAEATERSPRIVRQRRWCRCFPPPSTDYFSPFSRLWPKSTIPKLFSLAEVAITYIRVNKMAAPPEVNVVNYIWRTKQNSLKAMWRGWLSVASERRLTWGCWTTADRWSRDRWKGRAVRCARCDRQLFVWGSTGWRRARECRARSAAKCPVDDR